MISSPKMDKKQDDLLIINVQSVVVNPRINRFRRTQILWISVCRSSIRFGVKNRFALGVRVHCQAPVLSPATAVGMSLVRGLPVPSCPKVPSPQHTTPRSTSSAHVWRYPAETARAAEARKRGKHYLPRGRETLNKSFRNCQARPCGQVLKAWNFLKP